MKPTVLQGIKHSTKMGSLAMVACALLAPASNIAARSHGTNMMKTRPVIRVGIYDYAGIDRRMLRSAEGQAAALFAMAGVRIVWLECLPKTAPVQLASNAPAPDFSVRILRGSAFSQRRQDAGVEVMGESIIPVGVEGPVAGGIANIFYNRVNEVSSESGLFANAVLGEAIAHELGHLMLGPQHSHRGIMKVRWTSCDRELIAHCELRFLSSQAVELQAAARSLRPDHSTMIATLR